MQVGTKLTILHLRAKLRSVRSNTSFIFTVLLLGLCVAAGFAVKPSVDVAFGDEPVSDVKISTGARVNFPALVEAGKRIDGADTYQPLPQIPRSPFGITR